MAARMMITGFIQKYGDYEIIEAANGKEAVEQFRSNAPDFTFLDLTMPVMDGFEALKLIKESDRKALVAVLSADAQQKAIERVKELGAMLFIEKPVTEKKIHSALDKLKAVVSK